MHTLTHTHTHSHRHSHSPLSNSLVVHRMFPLARGLFEDKVANVWCMLDVPLNLRLVSDVHVLAKIRCRERSRRDVLVLAQTQTPAHTQIDSNTGTQTQTHSVTQKPTFPFPFLLQWRHHMRSILACMSSRHVSPDPTQLFACARQLLVGVLPLLFPRSAVGLWFVSTAAFAFALAVFVPCSFLLQLTPVPGSTLFLCPVQCMRKALCCPPYPWHFWPRSFLLPPRFSQSQPLSPSFRFCSRCVCDPVQLVDVSDLAPSVRRGHQRGRERSREREREYTHTRARAFVLVAG